MKLAYITAALAAPPLASDNPLQSVIALLEDMETQAKTDKQAEEVLFATYKQFCTDTEAEKTQAILDHEAGIDGYMADIESAKAQIIAAEADIAKGEKDIADWSNDLTAATSVRGNENKIYRKEYTDYKDSIYACEKAIEVLGTVDQQVAGAERTPVLLQKSKPSGVSQDKWDSITAFIDQAPYAIEASSGTVVSMLSKLKDEFAEEIDELQKKEMNAAHAFSTLQATLQTEIKNAETFVAAKKSEKGKLQVAQGDAEKNKADTEAVKAEDEIYRKDLVATCTMKANQFAQREQNRADEVTAIGEALTILRGEVVGAGESQRYSFFQMKSNSFMQMKSSVTKSAPSSTDDFVAKQKLIDMLRGKADKLGSKVLAQVAAAASEDPFGKVRQLISDLITRLTEETHADMDKKMYCDKEMTENKEQRASLNSKIAELSADKESLEAKIEMLTNAISDLDAELAALESEMEEMTSIRKNEHAQNTKTIEESKAAKIAVSKAIETLSTMYSKIGSTTSPTALLQEKQQPVAPEIFDNRNYAGLTGKKTGVIGILELIESDFAQLETETTTAEEEAVAKYEEFMATSQKSKEVKTQDRNFKEQSMTAANEELTDVNADLDFNNKELKSKQDYWGELKKQCIVTGVSYSERNVKRQEEIKSLQEALEILSTMAS